MPLWPAFCGGDYQARSVSIDAEQCINLYFETVASPENTKRSVLYGTPALKFYVAASDLGCRGAYSIDGRTFLVIGPTLYEVNTSTHTLTNRGTVANDSNPVSMVSNGRGGEQMIVVSGGQLKVLTLTNNNFSAAITLPLTNAPVMADFIDGYFILSEASTIRMWFSALNDGTTWNALNFFSRSHVNDNVVAIKVLQNKLWSFGSLSTEVFYDSGDATTPFLPYPGTVMQSGLVNAWALSVQDDTNSVSWVSQNTNGSRRIMRASSYAPQPISTPAVEFALAGYSSITDAESWSYEQEGHPFSVFTFPTADVTWVYDHRESKWHIRSSSSSLGVLHRWRVRGICAASSTVLLAGDYATSSVYSLDLDTFTDYCGPLLRVRRAPYLEGDNQFAFIDQLELGTQLASGSPTVNLRVSRDGAQTWSSTQAASLTTASTVPNLSWRRVGRCRLDRLVVEVSQSDASRVVWGPGMWIRVSPGSGQV